MSLKLSFSDWSASAEGQAARNMALASASGMDGYAENLMRAGWEAALAASGTEPTREQIADAVLGVTGGLEGDDRIIDAVLALFRAPTPAQIEAVENLVSGAFDDVTAPSEAKPCICGDLGFANNLYRRHCPVHKSP